MADMPCLLTEKENTVRQYLYATLFVIACLCLGINLPVSAGVSDDQYFDSDGVEIRYKVIGTGTPVILIHGFLSNFELNWQETIKVLAPHFQIIGMDARGHGKSSKPHNEDAYGVSMVKDVVRLMDHLSIKKSHVVGYSMGGMISLKMAALYPDRLYSSTTGGNGLFTVENIESMSAGQSSYLQKAIDKNILLPYDNDPQALIFLLKNLKKIALTKEEIDQISVPLFAIYGSLDDPIKTIDKLKAARPETQVKIIPDENHNSAPHSLKFNETLRESLLKIKR